MEIGFVGLEVEEQLRILIGRGGQHADLSIGPLLGGAGGREIAEPVDLPAVEGVERGRLRCKAADRHGVEPRPAPCEGIAFQLDSVPEVGHQPEGPGADRVEVGRSRRQLSHGLAGEQVPGQDVEELQVGQEPGIVAGQGEADMVRVDRGRDDRDELGQPPVHIHVEDMAARMGKGDRAVQHLHQLDLTAAHRALGCDARVVPQLARHWHEDALLERAAESRPVHAEEAGTSP